MNDLAYFISLMEKETEPSPNIWDRRARSWAHERKNNRKTDERLEKDFLFLENHGLLKKISQWRISAADRAALQLPSLPESALSQPWTFPVK